MKIIFFHIFLSSKNNSYLATVYGLYFIKFYKNICNKIKNKWYKNNKLLNCFNIFNGFFVIPIEYIPLMPILSETIYVVNGLEWY